MKFEYLNTDELSNNDRSLNNGLVVEYPAPEYLNVL